MSFRRAPTLLHGLFFLSGSAGLGYQIVWTGQLAVGLGHEMPSLLAVVTAFFGGLAIGAWALDRRIGRSAVPGRWYAALEAVIGVWALVLLALMDGLNLRTATLIGIDPTPLRHWLVAFGVPFLALLPATAAMGATLPAMDRLLCRLARDGRHVGGLYSANTLGAMAGVLASTFVLVPLYGFRASVVVLAMINLLCATVVVLGPAQRERQHPPADTPMEGVSATPRLLVTVFVTGLLGIGYEVLAVRVMGQVLQNTVYSYASALAVYLLATAAGAAVYQALGRRAGYETTVSWLVQLVGLSCLVGILVLGKAPAIYAALRDLFGHTPAGTIAAESVLALSVFLAPSFLMGATFSHLAQAARRTHGGVGRALGLNTLGGAAAPLLFGVVLLPRAGARLTLLVLAASYFALVPRLTLARLVPAIVAVVLVPLVMRSNLRLVSGVAGGPVVAYREGVMATVAVVGDPDGNRYLTVNNHFSMGSTRHWFAERRQAHLPLLLHPNPRRALFLGVGTGITVGAAATHPDLEVEAVELLPEVLALASSFDVVTGGLDERPNLRIHVGDARRHVRVGTDTYDVIVADLFHPARDGSGWLYTTEQFGAIRSRLAPGGIFCQWLPLFQLDEAMLRLVVRTFIDVFPNARAFMGHYNASSPILALVGSVERIEYSPNWFQTRVARGELLATLIDQRVALYNDFALFGCFVGGPDVLRELAGRGPRNTDDRPLLRFLAPRHVYRGEPDAAGRLLMLLDRYEPDPMELFGDDAGDFDERLGRFLEARNLYIRGGLADQAGDRRGAVDLYLQSVQASPDFPTSYVIVLEYARGPGIDPRVARVILRSLVEARPDRPEAAAVLRQMFGE